MISDRDNAKPPDPETEAKIERQKRDILREDRATREAKEKTKLKLRTAIKKFKDLNEEIESLTTVSKMSEQEIRLNMVESQKWEKKTEQFTTLKETIDQELISVDVENDLQEQVTEYYENVHCD